MTRSAAIVGGGIIGLSIAWRLSQAGWQVTVFDQSEIGSEASWAGAGMLAPGGETDGPSELASLCIESRKMYPSFVRALSTESGLAIDYQECGALDLAYSAEEHQALLERSQRQTQMGIGSKPVARDQVSVLWPRIRSEGLAGALFYPGDAFVNPRDVVLSLATVCHKRNVLLVQRCAVQQVSVASNRVEVETSQGLASFDAAVIAAGAWSSSVKVRGVPALPPSKPVKGHLIGYQQPDQTCGTIVRHGHTYLLQRCNGLLIAGASVEDVGFTRNIDTAQAAQLAKQASFVLPHLSEIAPSETWIGFRPASDQLHLGTWHSGRVLLAYGHYRNGILLAPVTAERIAAGLN